MKVLLEIIIFAGKTQSNVTIICDKELETRCQFNFI